jgi:CelD/BcsL family acetyltransferase involved in cellulose biosynthesis
VALILEQVDPVSAPPVDDYGDCTVFQTDAWLDFVEDTQRARRVVAVVRDGQSVVGRFTGLVRTFMGVRLLGSPFPGWTTAYMGFNLVEGVPRQEALAALDAFAFRKLGCAHYELMDRGVAPHAAAEAGYTFRSFRSLELDLSLTEEELLAAMSHTCRKSIRRAERDHLAIEEARDARFVDDYYDQLRKVFQRQGLVPTYDRERVASLVRHLLPTGDLLLLRGLSAEGRCLATTISLGHNGQVYAWGAAGVRAPEAEHLNEALKWYGLRYWKSRGMSTWDLGGWAEHKKKYGGREIMVPWIRRSRYAGLESLRGMARHAVTLDQHLRGAFNRMGSGGRVDARSAAIPKREL